jgi:hypothetical protein
MTTKKRSLWPPYTDPRPEVFKGMHPISFDSYQMASKDFTADKIKIIREVLDPPADFDLVRALQRAVHIYYQLYDTRNEDIIDLTIPSDKRLAHKYNEKIYKATNLFHEFLEEYNEAIRHLIGNDSCYYLEYYTLEVLINITDLQAKFPIPKKRKPINWHQRGFFNHLFRIYYISKNKLPTSRRRVGKSYEPYGPALQFLMECCPLVRMNLSPHTIQKHLLQLIKRYKEYDTIPTWI